MCIIPGHQRAGVQGSPQDDGAATGHDSGAAAGNHQPQRRLRVSPGTMEDQKHGRPHRTAQQDARVERRHAVLCPQLPRKVTTNTSCGAFL